MSIAAGNRAKQKIVKRLYRHRKQSVESISWFHASRLLCKQFTPPDCADT